MDIFSHGLWSSISFGRKNRRSFWLAFFFGVAPDLFSFGIYFVDRILGHEFVMGKPELERIPQYVYQMYDITHSLVIFTAVFLLTWLILRRPVWEMAGWALHILVDIPTHATSFFPTPFLWPIADVTVNGISWGHPYIFFPNVALLLIVYLYYFRVHKPRKGKREREESAS